MDETPPQDPPGRQDASELFDDLRVLAAENPKEARLRICRAIDDGSPQLPAFLRRISAPSEGRLRQLVANAVRPRADRGGLTAQLGEWYAAETDEFARRAIAAAIKDVSPLGAGDSTRVRPTAPEQGLTDLVGTYRYVADRLCHAIRNALPEPDTHTLRLLALARETGNREMIAEAMTLRETFSRLSRVVEFDVDDDYFRMRPVALLDWLETMNRNYAAMFEPIQLSVTATDDCAGVRVVANPFWLETAFRNIWKNAAQAVGRECRIAVEATVKEQHLVLLISDNGPGFPESAAGVAFQEQFSPKGKNHGRGLLEVLDAAQRLRGQVDLVTWRGGLRLRMRLPVAE